MDGKIALYRECCFPNCTKSWWIKFKRKSSTDRSFCENTRHICGVQVTSFLIIVCCFAFSIIVIAHRKRKAPKYKLWGDERSWRGWNNPPITGATILNVGVWVFCSMREKRSSALANVSPNVFFAGERVTTVFSTQICRALMRDRSCFLQIRTKGFEWRSCGLWWWWPENGDVSRETSPATWPHAIGCHLFCSNISTLCCVRRTDIMTALCGCWY